MKTRRTFTSLKSFCLSILVGGSLLLTSSPAWAQDVRSGLREAAGVGYGGNGSPVGIATLVGNVINTVIGISGVILLILILYAGFNYFTAMGDDAKVKKAKQTLSSAVIGLVLILTAYAIATFVIQQVGGLSSTTTAT